jgi:signal transduction histidine kinase
MFAAALLSDAWLVSWAGRVVESAERSLNDYVAALAAQVDRLVAGWAKRPGPFARLQTSTCTLLAQQAIGLLAGVRPLHNIDGCLWLDYVARCRAALEQPPPAATVPPARVARYLTEHAGCERRLPALCRRLADATVRAVSNSVAFRDAKLASLQELAYGASHEINNPLANIAGRAQTLLIDEPVADRRRALEAIHSQALRAHEMISDLMLFAQPPVPDLRPTDLRDLVCRVVAESRLECVDRNIEVAGPDDGAVCTIEADAVQCEVALRAVIANAMESIGRDGKIAVAIEQVMIANSPKLEIRVSDSGSGLDDRELAHAFDPFFSGREAGRGLGFGLTKAWRIVTAHGGEITIENCVQGGAMVAMRFLTANAP